MGAERILEEGHRYRLLTMSGQEQFSVEATADGRLSLLDAGCRVVEMFPAEQVERIGRHDDQLDG